jgi:hypothetical protein
MAIKLIAAYSKKIGLPGFSSHSFSVSMETELNDVENVASESERIYALLQENVDRQIQNTGYVPPAAAAVNNGGDRPQTNGGNGSNGDQPRHQQNGNGNTAGISEKQLDLISRIVRENNLNKSEVENLCVQMFGGGVRTLNRMQASNFIDELFERYGHSSSNRGNGNGRRASYQQRREPVRAS